MKNFLFLLAGIVLFSCQSPSSETQQEDAVAIENPAAPGFNANSDSEAIEIADKVMAAMGGRKSWDETRFLFWNFFGARTLLWDKNSGDVRIEFLKEDKKIIVNEKTGEGKVWKNGQLEDNEDSIKFYLERGERIWINDSYWLVMPFKLKDSGVLLSYQGEDTTLTGEPCEKVRLTFQGVGVTPDNAYDVWVSKGDDLVKQWAWFINATDSVPRFTRPWDNYQPMGSILLSDERGDRDLTEVKVLESVPEGIFESFDVSL